MGAYLTAYMVPQAIMQLDELPLTANGKVDKKALPEIPRGACGQEDQAADHRAATQLLGMYQKALGIDEVGVDDNFFEVGGTSLTAAKVMMAAMVANIPIVYQDIFDAPTVEGLERVVLAKAGRRGPRRRASPSPHAGRRAGRGRLLRTPAALSVQHHRLRGRGQARASWATSFSPAPPASSARTSSTSCSGLDDEKMYCLVRGW